MAIEEAGVLARALTGGAPDTVRGESALKRRASRGRRMSSAPRWRRAG